MCVCESECVWCECVSVCVCVCVCCLCVSVSARASLSCRHVLGRYLVRIFTGSSVIINDIFYNFSQLLRANQGVVPQVTIASFQVLSYSSSNSYPIIDATRTYSIVKQTTKKVSLCECTSVSLAVAGAVASFQISTIFGNSSLLLEVLCAAAWLP